MIKDVQPLSSDDFNKGLITRPDILRTDPNQSPNCMDIKWNFDGSIAKRFGSSTSNALQIGSTAAAGWTIDSAGTLSTSLQAWWKLDEASGARMDQRGGNTLSDNNATPSITGIRVQAALMAAANSNYLLRATTSPLETGNINFSMSSWIYLNSTSTTAERTIISKRDPDVDPGTVLLLHCDGTNASTSFPDSSSSAKAVTANGNAQVDTSQFEFGTGSCLLDGTGDFLSLLDSADWDFGTGNFTLDFWVRFSNVDSAAFLSRSSASWMLFYAGGQLFWSTNGGVLKGELWSPTVNTWTHVAIVRNAGSLLMFINGSQIGSPTNDPTDYTFATALRIGSDLDGSLQLNGRVDEVRVSKGVARWSANFTPPTAAYSTINYEYWLYVNTDNVATFRVSSSGSNNTTSVRASSMGALNTATWYRVVAWHSNNSHVGIDVNLSANTAVYTSGVRIGSAPFVLGSLSDGSAGAATTFMDGRVDETGFWKKVLTAQERSDLYGGGTGNTFSAGLSGFTWAMFDFGASNIRWLTVAAGSGLYASSNLGTTFVAIATSRTQNYQYLDRSKNVLIATSDSYDPPLYWAGSATTFAATLAPNSAPLAKFSVNYQGFLILLNFQNSNGTVRRRGFAYADENLQLTDTWQNSFDIPSSLDDEITAQFVLNKFLYVSTRYRIYRVAYIGGNPDWSYTKIKDWGFVPRTVGLITLKQGQVVVGMDWSRRLRAFDGYDDVFISNSVEHDNNYCDFATNKISYAGSGLVISNAVVDPNEQEYRLNVAIGPESTQTTHAIVLNGRSLAMYPYANQGYQCMCVAESNNQQFLMAADRSGFVHILNSGNLDAYNTPINDYYDSPILYKTLPSHVSKSQQLNFYFVKDSCGTIQYQDRVDLSNIFSEMRALRDSKGNTELKNSESSILLVRTVDVPSVQNTYQFRVSSSANTANPWELTHFDYLQTGLGIGKGVNG